MLFLLTCAQIQMCLGCICLGICPFEYFGLFKFCQLQWELYVSTLQKVFSTGGQYVSLCSPKVLRIMYRKRQRQKFNRNQVCSSQLYLCKYPSKRSAEGKRLLGMYITQNEKEKKKRKKNPNKKKKRKKENL